MEDPGLPLRPVVPGGAGGAMVPPHFSRSNSTSPHFSRSNSTSPHFSRSNSTSPHFSRSNSTSPHFSKSDSTKGGRLCPPNNNGTPGFSDLPTAPPVRKNDIPQAQ